MIGQADKKYGNKHSSNRRSQPQNIALGGFANQNLVIQKACQKEHIFVRSAKVRKVKDGMTEWEKDKQNELTEKAKKLVHAYGRKGFTIDKITKDRYICPLPFVGGSGPTEEDPDPVNASLLESNQ